MADAQAQAVEIFDVQGAGMTSPLVNQSVTLQPSVVTAVFSGGFFLQTPDARADSSILTSNGIRVIGAAATPVYGDGTPVQVGHLVAVQGTVIEQHGETRLQIASVTRSSPNVQSQPTAIELSQEAQRPRRHFNHLYCHDGLSNFECFEGMRVTLPDAMVVAGNVVGGGQNHGPVYISPYGRRSLREKGVRMDDELTDDNLAAGIWDSNAEILRMNVSALGALPPNTALVGGARFSASGILTVVDGRYTFWPTSISVDAATNVLPVSTGVTETANSFRIGTFDLHGGSSVNRLAAYVVEALGAPEVLAVQNVASQAQLDQLASAASAQGGAGVSYQALLGTSAGGSGPALGFLVRTDKIVVVSTQSLLAGAGGGTLHPQRPFLLEGSFSHGGSTHLFRVLNVHIDPRDGIEGDPALLERRWQQAESIATLVQGLQHDGREAEAPLMVAGKLNGWTRTDGYVDVHGLLIGHYYDPENLRNLGIPNIISPVMTSIVEQLPEDQQITTMTWEAFGNVQGETGRTIPAAVAFDHILLARDARRTVTEYGIARANADAPEILRTTGTGAVGSSVFDGLVVRMYPGCLTDSSANQDLDDWCDLFDNCPTVPNNGQEDSNGNGVGDACEPNGDMALSLAVNPDPAEPGQNVQITATVTHVSGDTIESPTLHLELPRRFAFQSLTAGGWSCNAVAPGTRGAELACTRASLASGSVQLTVVGTPDDDLPAGALLRVEGSVHPLDEAPENNVASAEFTISAIETDLSIVWGANPSPIAEVGDVLAFQLLMNNLGQRTADNAVVRMTRPHGTEISSVTGGSGWTCAPAGPSATELSCSRASFLQGTQNSIDFTLTVLPSASTTFTVAPELDSDTPDPNPANNSLSLVFQVTNGNPDGDRIFRDGFESP